MGIYYILNIYIDLLIFNVIVLGLLSETSMRHKLNKNLNNKMYEISPKRIHLRLSELFWPTPYGPPLEAY